MAVNPILTALGRPPETSQAIPPTQRPQANNSIQMIQQFQQFRQQMAGKDPRQMVQQMIQSGQMSQQQYDSLLHQAQGIMSMLHR